MLDDDYQERVTETFAPVLARYSVESPYLFVVLQDKNYFCTCRYVRFVIAPEGGIPPCIDEIEIQQHGRVS